MFGLEHHSATNGTRSSPASDLSPRRLSDLEASGLLDQCIRPRGGLLWPVVAFSSCSTTKKTQRSSYEKITGIHCRSRKLRRIGITENMCIA